MRIMCKLSRLFAVACVVGASYGPAYADAEADFPVYNRTQGVGYQLLTTAITDGKLQDNDVIVLTASKDIENSVNNAVVSLAKNVTICGANADVVMRRNWCDKSIFYSNGKALTIKDLIVDGTAAKGGKTNNIRWFFEITAGSFTCENIVFRNAEINKVQGIVEIKNQASLKLKDVTFTDCKVNPTVDGTVCEFGYINALNASAIDVAGKITGGALTLKTSMVPNVSATLTGDPIKLYYRVNNETAAYDDPLGKTVATGAVKEGDFVAVGFDYVMKQQADGTWVWAEKTDPVDPDVPQQGSGYAVPYQSSFDTSFGVLQEWTIIDVDNDSADEGRYACNAWHYNASNECAIFINGTDKVANDWIISPAIRLEAGKKYRFGCKVDGRYSNFEFYYGSDKTVDALQNGTKLFAVENYSYYRDGFYALLPTDEYPMTFTPQVSGDYYFGLHVTTTMKRIDLMFNDFYVIEDGVTTPLCVRNLNVTPFQDRSMGADLSWELPKYRVTGNEEYLTVTGQYSSSASDFYPAKKISIYVDDELVPDAVIAENFMSAVIKDGLTPGYHKFGVQVTFDDLSGNDLVSGVKLCREYVGEAPEVTAPCELRLGAGGAAKPNWSIIKGEKSTLTDGWLATSVGSSYYRYVRHRPNTLEIEDDWLVTPPVKFESAGKYRLNVRYKGRPSHVQLCYMQRTAQGEGIDVTKFNVIKERLYPHDSFGPLPYFVNIEQPGTYYFALHACCDDYSCEDAPYFEGIDIVSAEDYYKDGVAAVLSTGDGSRTFASLAEVVEYLNSDECDASSIFPAVSVMSDLTLDSDLTLKKGIYLLSADGTQKITRSGDYSIIYDNPDNKCVSDIFFGDLTFDDKGESHTKPFFNLIKEKSTIAYSYLWDCRFINSNQTEQSLIVSHNNLRPVLYNTTFHCSQDNGVEPLFISNDITSTNCATYIYRDCTGLSICDEALKKICLEYVTRTDGKKLKIRVVDAEAVKTAVDNGSDDAEIIYGNLTDRNFLSLTNEGYMLWPKSIWSRGVFGIRKDYPVVDITSGANLFYDSIKDAIDNYVNTDTKYDITKPITLLIRKNVEVGPRVHIKRSVNFEADEKGVTTITRSGNELSLLVKPEGSDATSGITYDQEAVVTFDGLVFDNGTMQHNKQFFESANSKANVSFNNCRFINVDQSGLNDKGAQECLAKVIGGGKLTFNGTTFYTGDPTANDNIMELADESTQAPPMIFYGKNSTLNIDNDCTGMSMLLEDQSAVVHAAENLSTESPIELRLHSNLSGKCELDKVVVSGHSDTNNFKLTNASHTSASGVTNVVTLKHDGNNNLVTTPLIPSGVEDVAEGAEDELPVYYNLQGMRMQTPVPGQLYIRKTGLKVEKIRF